MHLTIQRIQVELNHDKTSSARIFLNLPISGRFFSFGDVFKTLENLSS